MKNILLTAGILLLPMFSFAQKVDTLWFNNKWEKTERVNGYYFRTVGYDPEAKIYTVKDHYQTGKVQMEGTYSSLEPEVKEGKFTWWYRTGEKQKEADFNDNDMKRTTEWDLEGKVKVQQEMVNTVKYIGGEPVYEAKYIEAVPQFPGGMKALSEFLAKNVKYPAEAAKKGIGGKVIVQFVVNRKGKAVKPEVVSGVHPLVDAEALKVFDLMPRWEPGKQGGKTVNVKLALPVNFQP